MKSTRIASSFAAAFSAALLFISSAHAGALDQDAIAKAAGRTGTWIAAESVYKITVPRDDVPVHVDGWLMPPYMGLTSWTAFQAGGTQEAMVMGDLVLFQDEVNPVISALLDAGLTVTALHNHFFYSEPSVYFMHIGGEGAPAKLAAGVKSAYDTVKKIRTAAAQPATRSGAAALPEKSTITVEPLNQILGRKGDQKAGMAKFVIGRAATMACACDAGKEMGVNTWAAFAGADDNALVDGDFCMTETEVQGVIKTLRAGGINIVAIHHHMIQETPHYIFMHYWGRGAASDLAQVIKKALDTQTLK